MWGILAWESSIPRKLLWCLKELLVVLFLIFFKFANGFKIEKVPSINFLTLQKQAIQELIYSKWQTELVQWKLLLIQFAICDYFINMAEWGKAAASIKKN